MDLGFLVSRLKSSWVSAVNQKRDYKGIQMEHLLVILPTAAIAFAQHSLIRVRL